MSGVSTLSGLYAVKIHTDDMGEAVILPGILDQSAPTNTEVRQIPTSNSLYPEFQSVVAQKPMYRFSTLAIKSALGASGLLGRKIAATSNPGVQFFCQSFAEGGTRTAGSAHRSHTVKEGILIPRTLSVDHQGDARLTYEVYATYDGTNDPVVLATAQALPTNPSDAERYTLGPVTLGSITLGQKVSLEIDFGFQAESHGGDSEIWDRFCAIMAMVPSLKLKGIDPGWFAAAKIPLLGRNCIHANTDILLQKRILGAATFDATANIKFTACGLAYLEDLFSAETNKAGSVELAMPLRYDGSNAPLTVDLEFDSV